MRLKTPTLLPKPKKGRRLPKLKGKAKARGETMGAEMGKAGVKGDSEEVRKLKANAKRHDAENQKLKAERDEDDNEGPEEDDEEMDAEPSTKNDWERAVAEAEADGEHAESMLTKFPKSTKNIRRVAEAKAEAEKAREKLRELKDPRDQLRHKLDRERKLGVKATKLRESIRQNLLVIAEAQDELDSLREQLHESEEEMQRIESEKIVLVGAQAAPVDIEQCAETMRDDLGTMFVDPRLSSSARGKKDEVEAGFLAMRSLVATLSAVRLEIEAVKQQAAVTATASTADNTHSAAAEAPAAEGGAPTQTVETAAVPATVESPPPSAAAPVPDGPAQERTATRERTPPPGSRAKAISKMSDAELAGPRKAKLSKAGAAATA